MAGHLDVRLGLAMQRCRAGPGAAREAGGFSAIAARVRPSEERWSQPGKIGKLD